MSVPSPYEKTDEIFLIGKDENPFLQKILAIVGGITSFGALIPVVIKCLTIGGIKISSVAFAVFMTGYFVFPVIVLCVWLHISLNNKREALRSDYNKVLTKISKWLVWGLVCQIVMGICLIMSMRFWYFGAGWRIIATAVYLLYFTLLIIRLLKMLERSDDFYDTIEYDRSKSRYVWVYGALFASAILIVVLSFIGKPNPITCKLQTAATNISNNDSICYKEMSADAVKKDYDRFVHLEAVFESIGSLETSTRNICERYRIKSHMQWINDACSSNKCAKLDAVFSTRFCYERYDIKPYTDFFTALVLDKDILGNTLYTQFVRDNYLDTVVFQDTSVQKGNVLKIKPVFFNGGPFYKAYPGKNWEWDKEKRRWFIANDVAYIPFSPHWYPTKISCEIPCTRSLYVTATWIVPYFSICVQKKNVIKIKPVFFNGDSFYKAYLGKKWKWDKEKRRWFIANDMAYIPLIDSIIKQTLDADAQLIDTSLLEAGLNQVLVENGLIGDCFTLPECPENLSSKDSLNRPIYCRFLTELKSEKPRIDSLKSILSGNEEMSKYFAAHINKVRAEFAHYANEVNSRRLYLWMEDFIAYAQRQSQNKLNKTNAEVSWVFKSAQTAGLIIFITFFFTLVVFYYAVTAYRRALRNQAEYESGTVPYYEESLLTHLENLKKSLDVKLKIIKDYLFPATTFIGIIIALLIPLLKPIQTNKIDASRPDWFVSVPNWTPLGGIPVFDPDPKPAPPPEGKKESCKDCLPASVSEPPTDLTGIATRIDVENARDTLRRKIEKVEEKVNKISPYY